MNAKTFRKFLDRDNGCVHCGELEAVSPHHRKNRGMGGSKLLDRPANVIVLCSWLNNALESDATWAAKAREYGWKLRTGQEPEDVPVALGDGESLVLLDNDFGRVIVSRPDSERRRSEQYF